MDVIIKNCNCIDNATIKIKENALNIKYGLNGTGKSTICSAIKASINNNECDIKALTPYKAIKTNAEPYVEYKGANKVMVFNEDYVNQFVFKDVTFYGSKSKAYDVFIKNDEILKYESQINELQGELQKKFEPGNEYDTILNYTKAMVDLVTYKNMKVERRGGIKYILEGQGVNYDKEELLGCYRPFFLQNFEHIQKWAKWRTDGIAIQDNAKSNVCPYCGNDLPETITEINQSVKSSLNNAALRKFGEIKNHLDLGEKNRWIMKKKINELFEKLGDINCKEDAYELLNTLVCESFDIKEKLSNIKKFLYSREPSHTEMDKIYGLKINAKYKFYNTNSISNLFKELDSLINNLSDNYSNLKAVTGKYNSNLKNTVDQYKKDINEFFNIANFPYEFRLISSENSQAEAYVVPKNPSDYDEPVDVSMRFSWGEKNSFALVLFMFEAIKDNADFIVLDDPVSSFDKSKKFAILQRMFVKPDSKNTKPSFNGKTVLMVTHEIQPLIDCVYWDMLKDYKSDVAVNAFYLVNDGGLIKESEIHRDDFVNIVRQAEEYAKCEDFPVIARLINARRYIELIKPDYGNDMAYNLISCVIHSKTIPSDKDGIKYSNDQVDKGIKLIKEYTNIESTYDELLASNSTNVIFELINGSDIPKYFKILAARIYLEKFTELRGDIKGEKPAICRYVDESNHVPLDYIFQLDPIKFPEVPEYYLDYMIEKIIKHHERNK